MLNYDIGKAPANYEKEGKPAACSLVCSRAHIGRYLQDLGAVVFRMDLSSGIAEQSSEDETNE